MKIEMIIKIWHNKVLMKCLIAIFALKNQLTHKCVLVVLNFVVVNA